MKKIQRKKNSELRPKGGKKREKEKETEI